MNRDDQALAVVTIIFALCLAFLAGIAIASKHSSQQCIDGKLYKQTGSMLVQQPGTCVSLTEDPSFGQAEQQ